MSIFLGLESGCTRKGQTCCTKDPDKSPPPTAMRYASCWPISSRRDMNTICSSVEDDCYQSYRVVALRKEYPLTI